MHSFKFTNKAVQDLSSIWHYTCETWSEAQADSYYSDILDACEELVSRKMIVRTYDHLYPNLKGIKVQKHLIFYRELDDAILIVRILHERMDVRTRVFDPL